MKKIFLFGFICMFIFSASAFAAGQVVGDKSLLDTQFDKGLIIHLDEFYASHPVPAGEPTRGDNVFVSPRVKVDIVTNVGPNLLGLHEHTTCEEIVYIHKGQGEMYIGGKWVPFKCCHLHFNPRCVIHATRVTGEPLEVYSIFTPPQLYGNDRIILNELGEGKISNPALNDTKYPEGFVIDLDTFYAQHPLKTGEATRSDTVFQSPRAKIDLVTNRGPLIGRHYHNSCEEIVFVYKGQGEMYVDGEWIPVKAGDLHINPRGVIHATRVTGDEDMNVFSVFAPPQAGGNDKTMLDK